VALALVMITAVDGETAILILLIEPETREPATSAPA